jgi:predicted PurR-regulated permease PerM
MIIIITILSVLLAITMIALSICMKFVLQLNNELKSINEEQSHQNEDIRNLMIAHMGLVQVLKEASEIEQLNKVYNYSKIKGEA